MIHFYHLLLYSIIKKLSFVIIIYFSLQFHIEVYIISNLLFPIIKKLNVTIDIKTKHIISNHNPNALLEQINKYQAVECRS